MRKLTSVLALGAAFAFTTPAVAQDALKSAPANAFGAVHVDVKGLVGSKLFASLTGPLQNTPDFKKAMAELKTKADFDPMKDLSSVTIFLSPGKKGDPQPTIVARGKFNAGKIKAEAAKESGMKAKKANGVEYFVDAKAGMGVTITNGAVVIGTESSLAKALKGTGGNAKLTAAAKQVSKGDTVWFAMDIPAELRKQMGGNPMANDLRALRGSVNLAGEGLGLKLALGTAKADTATKLAAMINQQLKQAASAPPFGAMVSKVKATASGSDVKVSLDLNAQEVQQIQMMAMMMMGAMNGAKAAPAAPAKK